MVIGVFKSVKNAERSMLEILEPVKQSKHMITKQLESVRNVESFYMIPFSTLASIIQKMS
jgi:hypothetical protein